MSNMTPLNNQPNSPNDHPAPGTQPQQPQPAYHLYPTSHHPVIPQSSSQPTYSPYIPPGYPPMYELPEKRSPVRRVLFTLAIILLLCIAAALLLFGTPNPFSNAFGIALTTSQFCSSEKSANYIDAYQQLSTQLQQHYSEVQFVNDGQQRYSSLGPITNCATQTPTVNGTMASLTFDVTRTLNGTPKVTSGQVTLVIDGNSWKIDSIDPLLNLP